MADAISLFTTDLMNKVDQLSAEVQRRAAPPYRGRVLVVPALPGSQLGHRAAGHDDVVWLELDSIREGRLFELGYDAPGPALVPLGGFEPVYLQLILRLRLAGYDVDTHAYDWRRPVRELGRELADRIRAEGREVHLVAHSYGGLVCRAACLPGADGGDLPPPAVGRVIMLGTPNQGSFEVVQGLRGIHWVLRLLAAVDGAHSAVDLATRCFGTWPSVYDALPPRTSPDDLDLFDPGAWPKEGPRPDESLLADAARASAWLAGARGQFHVIAGFGVPTVERLEIHDGVFRYHRSDGGDGLVTTGRARLDGHPCYFTRCAHAGMPNHQDVIAAVEDILDHGAADQLPTQAPASSPCTSVSDEDPVAAPFEGRRGSELSPEDLRAFFDELAGFIAPVPMA